jgi:hypothetical protein
MAPAPKPDLDILHTVPLAEFTARRNALVAQLRSAGHREEAAAVARLKKPSVPVWVVNTVAREEPDAVRALVDATERLKRAQMGGRQAMGEATQAQRRALQTLMRSAERILARGGFGATTATRQRISNTLLGGATDRDARQALQHGRLTDELAAPSFEALAGMSIKEAPGPRRAEARRSRAHPREDSRVEAARRAARARMDALAEKARTLAEEAAAREREAATAARAVTALQERLEAADARARERRQAADKATAAAERARQEATRAAAEFDRGDPRRDRRA